MVGLPRNDLFGITWERKNENFCEWYVMVDWVKKSYNVLLFLFLRQNESLGISFERTANLVVIDSNNIEIWIPGSRCIRRREIRYTEQCHGRDSKESSICRRKLLPYSLALDVAVFRAFQGNMTHIGALLFIMKAGDLHSCHEDIHVSCRTLSAISND